MNDTNIATIYKKVIPIGYDIALHDCSGGYPDKDDCTWYHGNWMLLRYLGVVSNPYWHESFYKNALQYVHANTKKIFLVAGTADFSMPLLCSESGIDSIDICDICGTPLRICQIVSEFVDCKWMTFVQDICTELPMKYDIIINDAFLSRFIEKDKPLKGIVNGLKQGGYYITTLKQGKQNRGGDISNSIRRSFMQKVRERYIMNKTSLPDVDIDNISALYADKMSSYPVSNEGEVYNLFSSAGLTILSLERGHVEGEFESSDYFRIVSKK